MASSVEKEGSAAAHADGGAPEEPVWLDLPAPSGWTKKLFPKKSPKKNEIVFTAPTGEEIHTRRHLEKYLKRNGGPNISEFYWGTGETPRRSARIIEKAKAAPLVEPESEPPKKRSKKSSASKKEVSEDEEDGETTDKANDKGKSSTTDGDLQASKENIDDKGAEGPEVVQNKNEEKIGQPAEERKLDGRSQEAEKSE